VAPVAKGIALCDLIHKVNSLRKETGLELSDRILLDLSAVDADLLPYAEWIKAETVAASLTATGDDITLTRVGKLC
jgi:hypothetical protein